MQDWHKFAIALVALALVVGLYCKQGKEQLRMPTPSPATMPNMDSVTIAPASAGGLMPADVDATDYGPFGATPPTQCQLQNPYTA